MGTGRRKRTIGPVAGLAVLLGVGGALAGNLPRAPEDRDYRPVRLEEAALGQLLFFDPVLSGNQEVACATCHHPRFGTSDGLSLPMGDGGIGLGPERRADPDNPPEDRVPRNAQALFNLGAREFRVMFMDGRVEADDSRPGGIRSPLGEDMVKDFASVLSAQSMFPVLSADEMAGHYSENEVSRAVRQGLMTGEGGAWDIIARRVAAYPDYVEWFAAVYDRIDTAEDIDFVAISDAIAAFIEFEWRSDDAPFDAWLRGEGTLPAAAERGAALFYGEAGCSGCHSGPFLTDHDFHAMGDVQLGPGKAAAFERHQRDTGRYEVTGDAADLYAFRTPSLRNVAQTGPYGHAGSHAELADYLAAHADPLRELARYDRSRPVLPEMEAEDWWVMDRADEIERIVRAVERPPLRLRRGQIDDLVVFLGTLSDPVALRGRLGVPARVPSGLPVPGSAVATVAEGAAGAGPAEAEPGEE
ncbi:cytochrome-c peroxidase, partial [Aquicoccus sp. SCR17]|nr:cytochrome-c peroxidase [Carideicomes alvinocaridis]